MQKAVVEADHTSCIASGIDVGSSDRPNRPNNNHQYDYKQYIEQVVAHDVLTLRSSTNSTSLRGNGRMRRKRSHPLFADLFFPSENNLTRLRQITAPFPYHEIIRKRVVP